MDENPDTTKNTESKTTNEESMRPEIAEAIGKPIAPNKTSEQKAPEEIFKTPEMPNGKKTKAVPELKSEKEIINESAPAPEDTNESTPTSENTVTPTSEVEPNPAKDPEPESATNPDTTNTESSEKTEKTSPEPTTKNDNSNDEESSENFKSETILTDEAPEFLAETNTNKSETPKDSEGIATTPENATVPGETNDTEGDTTPKPENTDNVETQVAEENDETKTSENAETPQAEKTSENTEATKKTSSPEETTTNPSETSSDIEKPQTTQITAPLTQANIPKKKGKIKIIFLLIVLLLAIGGVIWWLIVRSTPEAKALDAISNFATAKNIVTRGGINLNFDQESASAFGVKGLKLDLNYTSSHIPDTSSATISVTTTTNTTYKIDLGETLTSDGTIYIKIDGLKKAISSSSLPQNISMFLDYYSRTINAIDGQWWMISIPDLSSDVFGDQETKDKFVKGYECTIKHLSENSPKELTDLYKTHNFIKLTPYSGTAISAVEGGDLYSLTLDKNELGYYLDELENTKYAKELYSCFDSNSTSASTTTSRADIESLNLPDIYLEIAGFDHHLSQINVPEIGANGISGSANLHFTYPDNVSIETPTNAKPITDLVKIIMDETEEMFYNIFTVDYSDYPIDNCMHYTEATNCKS